MFLNALLSWIRSTGWCCGKVKSCQRTGRCCRLWSTELQPHHVLKGGEMGKDICMMLLASSPLPETSPRFPFALYAAVKGQVETPATRLMLRNLLLRQCFYFFIFFGQILILEIKGRQRTFYTNMVNLPFIGLVKRRQKHSGGWKR